MANNNSNNSKDIRLEHVTAIRERLKEKKQEYCIHTNKKSLGPDAIRNYLQNAGIHISRTTIQNFFSDKDNIIKMDISMVLKLCEWWGCNASEILAFPNEDSISTNNSFKENPHQKLLTDSSYDGTFYCYFFKISGTDSSFHKSYPYSLNKKEDLMEGTITFEINSDNDSKAIFEYIQCVHQFNQDDELKPKRCTCFPMESIKNNNIYLDFVDQDGRFYYIFFNHQIFTNGPLYFRIGGMVTEASENDNGPIFQKIVLFHEKPSSSQFPLIRGLLNTNPHNILLDEKELELLATQDEEIKEFMEGYKDLLAPRKREVYFFNETLITKESGPLSEFVAKKILIKLRHYCYSQNQIIIGRDPDAHRIARRMQNPANVNLDDYQ
jgi:DNA-binding Xre family transcriptional regulator